MKIADRVSRIEVSSTLLVLNEAQRLAAAGKDVVDLGAGEPDFPTPDHIKEAAKRALDENFTKYTNTLGIPELRNAVVERYEKDFQAHVKPSQVMATVGGKQALFDVLMALINPGDEVIIPSPYWVTFPQIVLFAGGTPVYVLSDLENGFKVSAEALGKKINAKTRAIIINSPCNPTGAVIEWAEFIKIAELAVQHDLVLISDECYSKFLYDGSEPFSAAGLDERLRKHIIVAGTLSKTYAMTGWRVGYAIAPEEIIGEILKIQSHSTSNPTSIAQKAAVAALRGSQECVREMVAEFKRRRDYIVSSLNEIPGITCSQPHGAFYVFPNVSGLMKKLGTRDAEEFSRRLIREQYVAVTPGPGFGVDGFVRISYAAAMDRLKEAIARLRKLAA
jgi:aspartate aminotransferase